MSVRSKGAVTSMAVIVALLLGYLGYALGPGRSTASGAQGWGLTVLVFAGIAVVVLVVAQILFHIVVAARIAATEARGDQRLVVRIMDNAMADDEMDAAIRLRAHRVGMLAAVVGFLAGLAVLAVTGAVVVMIHVMLGGFVAGALAGCAVTVLGYQRGVHHG